MERKKVVKKIRGLLANARPDSGNPEEALASYARKARQLIEKHQIEQAEILEEEIGKTGLNIDKVMYKEDLPTGDWMWELSMTVASFFDCKVVQSINEDCKMKFYRRSWIYYPIIYFIGTPEEAEAAQRLYASCREYLREKLIKLHAQKGRGRPWHGPAFRQMINDYVRGFDAKLYLKLKEIEKARIVLSDGRDLVVVKEEEIKEYTQNEFPNLKTNDEGPSKIHNPYLFREGVAAGTEFDVKLEERVE